MNENEAKEKIRHFLVKFIKKFDLKDDEDIFESRLVNSLFAMQLVLFVEKEFKIKVENKDLDLKNFNSINSIFTFIDGKKSA
ncbi:MAG: acyl carrier protein [Candidatus Magnetomorum sp.]|nr:acyl carrier protein [Candidatus Magnetomorum sp.]